MNRIVLIGNGFDLANNYKTSYKDFIVWYFKEKLRQIMLKAFYNMSNDKILKIKKIGDIDYYVGGEINEESSKMFIDNIFSKKERNVKIEHISKLLLEIVKSYETKGWVDIESDYYRLLCTYISNGEADEVKKLNEDLDFVKEKLIEYLKEVSKEKKEIYQDIQDKIFGPFKEKDIAVKARNIWKKFLKRRFNSSEHDLIKLCSSYELNYGDFLSKESDYRNMLKDYLENGKPYDNDDTNLSYPDNIMLLNFNYTDIADRYLLNDSDIFSVVYIHGKLDDPKSVILGYADEFDKFYKEINEQDDNESLKNIKFIRYHEANNYKKVLSFIESDYYQVYIMGHSCGKSDRSLLKKLFEHEHCVSIKPFYYYVDKEKKQSNYIDIVQNINKILGNGTPVEDKVVSKPNCLPLKN